eukprot:gene16748-19914_t
MSKILIVLILSLVAVFAQQVEIRSTSLEGVCTGKSAAYGDEVSMHYVGKLEDGSVFDASGERGPFPFILGAAKVIPGIETGVLGICEGEKREIFIPYQFAYGETGIDKIIPARANLIFTVEVVAINKLSEIPFYLRLIPSMETVGAFGIVSSFVYLLYRVLKSFPPASEKKMPRTKAEKEPKKKTK